MAHGGTNFGFFSGANAGQSDSDFKADLTSYDYDAPIKEHGDVDNPKFKAIRSVIEKYSGLSLPQVTPSKYKKYGSVKVRNFASLFGALDVLCDPRDVIRTIDPVTMESVDQMYGFLLYVSEYRRKSNLTKEAYSVLSLSRIHDRAQVFVSCSLNKDSRRPRYAGTIERWSNKEIALPNIKCSSNISLFVLVENMGRVNYGSYLHDKKGILSSVIVDGSIVRQWKMYPITLSNFSNLFKENPIMQVSESTANKFSRRHSPKGLFLQTTIYKNQYFMKAGFLSINITKLKIHSFHSMAGIKVLLLLTISILEDSGQQWDPSAIFMFLHQYSRMEKIL